MKQMLGTKSFSGLNVGTTPHLIEPHELTESENGWTDELGSWITAKGPARQHGGYSNIIALAAGRMGGSDHLVYGDSTDGNLYDNGSQVSIPTEMDILAGTKIYATDDGFIITGGAKNYLYDSDGTRELGPWQSDRDNMSTDSGVYQTAASAQPSVSTISKASNARITFSAGHSLTVGDYAYVTGADMTQINSRPYIVTAIDDVTFLWADIDVDSTNFTTYTAGATVYYNGCGLTGTYRWYITQTIRLSSGSVIESKPLGLGLPDEQSGYEWPGPAAREYTVAATEYLLADGYVSFDSSNIYDISGTKGVDYWPGVRLYRTKNAGTDFYLEKEWEHGDSDFVYSAGTYNFKDYIIHTPDPELGAVYRPSETQNTAPAKAGLVTAAGQRIYFVPSANTNELHWTELDGIYYSDPLSFITVPDVVTAIYGFRDRVVVWSADRMWVFDLTGGIPDLKEVVTPVGTTYDQAIARTDMGILFLRLDGLWLFDGVRVTNISRKAFASITSPKSVCAAADTIYVSGEDDSYVIRIRDDGWTWHKGDKQYIYADDTSGKIYGASQYSIDELFAGASIGGKMTTKRFGVDLQEWTAIKVWIDVSGSSAFDLTVNGDIHSDVQKHYEEPGAGEATRRIAEISIPRLINPHFSITIECTGALRVYGMASEVIR